MKKTKFFALMIAMLLVVFAAKSQEHSAMMGDHKMTNTGDIQWMDGPGSLPPGAKYAVIEGDLSKPGPFTARIQLPANYEIPAHWHPAIEHVTVLEGSFYMGAGDKLDKSKGTRLNVGGFAVMPIDFRHFAYTTEPAVIQLHGMGPWGITYVNSTEDPRKKK
ncbi:MAG: cupin domain-containing protein [Bacteroidia bacterium]